LLEHFPETIKRDWKANGVPVHQNLNPVTQGQAKQNDCE
jgi:hypothetical protein